MVKKFGIYKKFDNKICHNNYTPKEKIESVQKCKEMCTKDKNCGGFSYHKGWKQCRIAKKCSCNPGDYANSTYYHKECDGCSVFPRDYTGYRENKGKECSSGIFNSYPKISSFKDCKRICDTQSYCKGFSYAKDCTGSGECKVEDKPLRAMHGIRIPMNCGQKKNSNTNYYGKKNMR